MSWRPNAWVAVLIHTFLTWHYKEMCGQLSASTFLPIGWEAGCLSLPVCMFVEEKMLCLCLEPNSNCCYKLTLWNRLCFEKLIFFLSSQEISCILWKPLRCYRIYNSLPFDSILNYRNTIYSLLLYFIKIYFDITSHLRLGFLNCFFQF